MDREFLEYLERTRLGCQEIEQLVDAYVDGELPDILRERFDGHRSECLECNSLVFDIEQIVQLAKTLDDEPLPIEIGARLRQKLKETVGFEPPPVRKLTVVK